MGERKSTEQPVSTSQKSTVTNQPVRSKSDGLRRPISITNPLFQFHVGFKANIMEIYLTIPEDILEYSVFILEDVVSDSSVYDWVRSQLDYAKAHNINVIIQNVIHNTFEGNSDKPPMSMSDFDKLFNEYSVLIGASAVELSCGTPLNDMEKQYVIDTIKKCAEYGGLFIWKDMGYIGREHVFLKAGEDNELFRTIKSNRDIVILVDKNNGNGQYHLTRALTVGWWLADAVDNWGVNIEDFWWWENGYGPLWEESAGWRKTDMFKSIFTSPDALFGQGMLPAIAAGATVFSFEWSNRVIWPGASVVQWRRTPTFNKVIYPLLKKIANNGLIPTKKEVLSNLKVAYHATDIGALEIRVTGEGLFRGLYGNTHIDTEIRVKQNAMRYLPTTGRYHVLPVLPKLVSNEILDFFPCVITPDSYANLFPDENSKIEFFNNVYDEKVRGDSWAVEVNGKWFLTNPNENVNIVTDFKFSFDTHLELSMSGRLHPHSYLIVEKNADGVSIYINNYRTKIRTLWNDDISFNINDHLQSFVTGPDESDVRITRIVLAGIISGKPELLLSGDEGYSWVEEWNNTTGSFTIEITHNGQVDIKLIM